MPISDDMKSGHKFPFNACEILCSDNSFIINKLLENTKLADEDEDSDDSDVFKKNGRKFSDEEEEEEEKEKENEKEDDKEEKENGNEKEDDKEEKRDEKEKENDKEEKENENLEKNLQENILIKDDENAKENDNDNDNVNFKENESLELSELEKRKKIIEEMSNELESNSNENVTKEEEEDSNEKTNSEPLNFISNSKEEEEDNRPKKRGKHQKKEQISNTNININNLISENEQEKEDNLPEFDPEKDDECLDLSNELAESCEISQSENSGKKTELNLIFPNLNHFFDFLESNNDLNYVLSGYFFKIFNHLFNFKKENLLTFCFKNNSEILKKLILNLDRKSICDCLFKLLTDITIEKIIDNSQEIKIKILVEIFEEIENFESEALMNLSDLIIDCLGNKKFYFIFIEEKIFSKILDLLKKDYTNTDTNPTNKNDVFKCVIKIMNFLNENILKEFGNKIITPLNNNNTNSEDANNDPNLFSFNAINLGQYELDEDFDNNNNKISPEEIKQKLDKNYPILCEISFEIIKEFIKSDEDLQNAKLINTTFNKEKRALGTKRYNY